MKLSRDGKAKEYPIQFPNKLEIELDISFIYQHYKHLKSKEQWKKRQVATDLHRQTMRKNFTGMQR